MSGTSNKNTIMFGTMNYNFKLKRENLQGAADINMQEKLSLSHITTYLIVVR